MATTSSPILGLVLPTPGTAEPYNRTTENSNLTKLENAIGAKTSRFTTVTLSNSTTETGMYSQPLAAGQLQGATHRMVAWGTYDNSAVSTTITWRIKIGGVQVTAYVQTTPASLTTFVPWRIEFDLVVTTTGVSGTWRGAMLFGASPSAGDINKAIVAGSATTRDTTIVSNMDITAQWAAASASNTIRCDAAYYHRITNS